MSQDDRIGLADFIQVLRDELKEAQDAAEGDAMSFRVEDIDVELTVVLTKKGNGKIALKVPYLVSGEVGGNLESARTQKLKLRLKADGEADGPLKISRGPAASRKLTGAAKVPLKLGRP